jgi:maltose alpha-D-glucosyltransferase/alpha-amylase
VIYELHVRAFFDSDGDGIGDFAGLTQRLDYLQDLGITAIWLLPFYPSPLRDEGYDISDYRGINPAYGTLRQFRRFLDAAHRRGLRVITEIVLNHTSDQHPWFERARRAPRGSRYRNWYVWSDDPSRYGDARIIFRDFEQSNWSWDPVAQQYYWHRFYAHQPDLNFDNPEVRREMLRTVEYWLDLGVDGLRLDAIPYLFEREGTTCENLPETHEFLRDVRRRVGERFADRMLLAEANQWPEDAAEYFGAADECHMAFHFPLMPRLFMGLRMEDRFPIIDILRQTPPIPDDCQWAVFLRNHDELTLEMVTDEERDYMYRAYAHDPEMRINFGIRRRLAPLLYDHRHKVELMHGLLCSLPGTPVLYYGDEIGMGDNVYLGDRDGVRTPMQWSADRNAGFSTANPQRLYLPVIIDPQYHYETVNVAAQLDNPDSLLWWVRRLIALRKRYPVFGRGTLEVLSPDNHHVLAFVRRLRLDTHTEGDDHEQRVLVVANLSRHAQYVELDLSEFRGARPMELFGQTTFPAIGDLPYLLTLGPHAFYWLALEAPREHPAGTPAEELPTLTVDGPWTAIMTWPRRRQLEAVLPRFLGSRRWFGAKGRTVSAVRITDTVNVALPFFWSRREQPVRHGPAVVAFVQVEYRDGDADTYVVPLAFVSGPAGDRIAEEQPSVVVARLEGPDAHGVVIDAHWLPGYGHALLAIAQRRRRALGQQGSISGRPGPAGATALTEVLGGEEPVTVLRGEQSNTSILFGERLILKTVRRVEEGESPELEIGHALGAQARFAHVPAIAGSVEYSRGRRGVSTLAVVHEFVPHESDAYTWYREAVTRFFDAVLSHADGGTIEPEPVAAGLHPMRLLDEEVPALFEHLAGGILPSVDHLGTRTGELHRALASVADDPAFTPEPMTALAKRSTYQSMRNNLTRALRSLERAGRGLPESVRNDAEFVLQHGDDLLDRLRAVMDVRGGRRIRVHGDLHLGQVLSTGRDFIFIDFEGEPARSIAERRVKRSPLRDVAGMLRSFDYAARTSIPVVAARGQVRSEDRAHELLERHADQWVGWVSAAYLRGYLAVLHDTDLVPTAREDVEVALDAHLVDKACYELRYEVDHRPDWVTVPVAGLRQLLRTTGILEDASR